VTKSSEYGWIWWPTGIACAAALYAAIGHPSEYGFYVLARISVTIAAGILAIYLRDSRNDGLFFGCLAAVVVFNPFIPLPLGRPIWMLMDLAVVVLLIVSTVRVLNSPSEAND
jgi:hypothetical protein